MRKKLLAAIITLSPFIGGPVTTFSQAGGDYIVHTIQHGEVPSVLAKKYNVTLADLASLNKWGPTVILHAGDKVKLPLGAHLSNGGDSAKPAAAVLKQPATTPAVVATPAEQLEGRSVQASPAITPPVAPKTDTSHFVIHTIQPGEIPSVLAKKYNINVEEVKRINNWTPKTIWHVGDKVKLPHSPSVSATAENINPPPATLAKANTPPVIEAKPVVDTIAKTPAPPTGYRNIYTIQKKETLYSIGKKYGITPDQIKSWNNLPNNNISEGQTLVLYTAQPVAQQNILEKNATPEPVKESPPPTLPVVESTPTVQATQPPAAVVKPKPVVDTAAANTPSDGYFSTLFGKDVNGRSLQIANGLAMTFKTASGWTDKKYYVLMNEMSPGSIVKITTSDGKFVYAKILWNMGDAQDNEGLNFRISDAAAAALGIKDLKFPLTVTYYR